MRVQYKTYTYHDVEKINHTDLSYWIGSNLGYGGIESNLRKLRELATLFTEDYLARHPEEIGKVADIIDAIGVEHKLVADEEVP